MRVSVATGGLPGRYASALFDLAAEAGALDTIAADTGRLQVALRESPEFAQLTTNPLISRGNATVALKALADSLGLQDLTFRFLAVLAENGRLAILADVLAQFDALLNAHKGVAVAHVVSAHELNDRQVKELQDKLQARTGRNITLDMNTDPDLLGGLIVRIGSEQIDSSIRTRLHRLGQQMKG